MTFFDMLKDNRGFALVGEEEDDPIISDEEEESGGGSDVEVDLDLDEEPEPEDAAPPAAKKAWAAMRTENKELKQTVEELKRTVENLPQHNSYVPPVQQPQVIHADTRDPRNWTEQQWDELAKTDWKKAVDLRSSIQAEDKIKTTTHLNEFERVMEDAKQRVLSRHPELNDPNSEKAKIYRNIVTANPEYTAQKKGPLMAMYEMEEYMEKNMGYKREDIVKAEVRAREEEAKRRDRVTLTSTTGHHISGGNKVTITKDEMEFCKLQGIDPKVYASNKKKLESSGKGGIQL